MASRYGFSEYKPPEDIPDTKTNPPDPPKEPDVKKNDNPTPTTLEEVTVHIRIKFKYAQLKDFVEELKKPNDILIVNGKSVSVLQVYSLRSTNTPIDMSNQTERSIYRPNLFIRKNDKFGPWNFNFLLNLFELDYRPRTNDGQFPKIWQTTSNTSVDVIVIPYTEPTNDGTETTNSSVSPEAIITLEDLLASICRQNKCDAADVKIWKKGLSDENINTIEHLQNTVMNESLWEKLNAVRPAVKQMICDYVQLNAAAGTFNQTIDPYKESPSTLLGDIHRVKRYFYHTIGQIQELPYLDRKAVDLAIDEIRLSYDDDGNVLSTIHDYLRTFCSTNTNFNEKEIEIKIHKWSTRIKQLKDDAAKLDKEIADLKPKCTTIKQDLQMQELRWSNICNEEKEVEKKANELTTAASKGLTSRSTVLNLKDKFDEVKKIRDDYQKKKKAAEENLEQTRIDFQMTVKKGEELLEKLKNNQKEKNDLESKLKLIEADEHRKLKVKIGRGLLLYGPPGTGKSELLKRAAVYAGITMTTVPLAAGELNRPYVGETEKLLIDIMYRANTIPHLICAMTIDEIDGLVPKRDNNAQQSKVDGISVLLSHIEGVKNIPNLIVFGATNRRNMMDDAFLRRMQAKCFVGRPSPQIRKKMLQPLLTKDLKDFTDERLDFLVKITTNFSGAAVGALKSSIIIFLADNPTTLSDHTLLSLADNTAREFSCWFGSGTLPEICRIHPNIFNSNQKGNQLKQFSLALPEMMPSGRILIDLQDNKCFIELSNGPTLEKPLIEGETSLMTLLARIITGCSSRNIDTIQIIDTDFLSKNNAFDENQIFELLTTIFLECNEYNRSMLIFDIDSLIMLSINDSNMSQSLSISNIRLYQFIREKCKQAFVERKPDNSSNQFAAKEKWIVMIVKHSLLRSRIIEDIYFKKSTEQLKEEEEREKKARDDETEKICPKCRQAYILSKTNFGNCRYHDGYVFHVGGKNPINIDDAQTILQAAKLSQARSSNDQHPKLVWACCLGIYGSDPPCRIGICGLPQELQATHSEVANQIEAVEKHFRKNPKADAKIKAFVETYGNLPKPSPQL